ncbi:MAG: efflux RND transporter permease subunit [Bacteroidia bacterium]|nr:efflux RND transporter permease subunit [Bacteroidia bacterium]
MLRKLLDRPVMVTMAMLVVIVLGIVSIRLLPVSLIPDVNIPYVTVQVSAPDMSARELDESVLKPLRQQLIQINSLADMVCSSKDGSGVIKLTFDHGADADYLFIEVNEKIDRTIPLLPDIDRPRVLKASATDIPAFYINVTSRSPQTDFSSLSSFVQDVISKRFEQLPEVAMVDLSGYVTDEILIIPDAGKLAQLDLSQSDFESLVTSANVRLGSLSIRDGQYRYNVKFLSDVSGKEDVENIRFRKGDRVFRLKDIASVLRQSAARQGLVRSDGKDAVCMAVIKQSGARMAALKSSVGQLVEQFEIDYPQMDFAITRDQTELLSYSINNLIQNIVLGIVLACIIIFLFMMDFKSPALVTLTMPVALIFSMAVFYAAGLTLNIISLAGLLLGVGMMADNTIILIDNITARRQRGEDIRKAVLRGTSEVTGPMLSSVLTTCAVFIPLVFLSGMAGSLFYDEAMSVTIVLLTSYLVTITVIPVYYYRWNRKQDAFIPAPFLQKISVHEPLLRAEERGVNWFISHSWAAWGLLAVSVAGTSICLALMPKTRLPEITYHETIMNIDWNEQISLEENTARVAGLEKAVEGSTVQLTSMAGIQQFILGHSGDLGPTEVSVYMDCSDAESLDKAKAAASDYMAGFPAADWSFGVAGNVFDMVFGGDEPELLARLRPVSSPELETGKVNAALSDIRAALPGVRIADLSEKTDLLFIADPDLMSLYDVSYSSLVSVLKNAMHSNRLFTIVQGSRTLPVVTGSDRKTLWETLQSTYINKVPVSAMMRQTYVRDFKSIVSGVEGNYYPLVLDVAQSDVPETVDAVRTALRGRGDFEASFSGTWFSSRELAGEMAVVFLIAAVLLYLILASQFESLLQPFLIMAEIVVDIFASLALLWITGVSINLMSLIGLVVVSGIVINDSILKVDTINRLRREGMELREAVVEASGRRMKAIIMTSLTTILAVVPFLGRGNMGDDLQYPMSIVIIAGMVVGTLVSLLVLPALYWSIYRKK